MNTPSKKQKRGTKGAKGPLYTLLRGGRVSRKGQIGALTIVFALGYAFAALLVYNSKQRAQSKKVLSTQGRTSSACDTLEPAPVRAVPVMCSGDTLVDYGTTARTKPHKQLFGVVLF